MKFVDDGSFKLEWQKGVANQKLEEGNHKFLSLDPRRNPNPHHHHHLYLNQENQNYVGESEQEEEQSASTHVPFQQHLYSGRLDFHHHNLPPPPPPQPQPQPKKRSSTAAASEHAKLREKMAESSHQQQKLGAVGEIVEVQGGHIVRSIGRKDRHSKVCTAKGPRDRRVRLAAHTAIQFYDVQDRLGYDRPSKAVDWLIKKAQAAIDELAQNPAWHPTAVTAAEVPLQTEHSEQKQSELMNSNAAGKRGAATMVGEEDEQQTFHRRNISENPNSQISSFLPPSVDSDSIADTIKSFFPVGASGEASSSAMQFQSFTSSDLMSRSSNHSQDLRLSLQSLQDPNFQQHQNPNHHAQLPRVHGQLLLTGTPLGFDASSSGWSDHHHHHAAELSRFQKFTSFGGGGDPSAAAAAPYYFNSPPAPQPLLQQLLGYNHNQLVSQRGPLQSSNTPSIRAWIDPSAAVDQTHHHHHHHHQQYPAYPLSSGGFASSYGGFPGFHIPARIQGDEEEHDGYSDKPSSASSDYRH